MVDRIVDMRLYSWGMVYYTLLEGYRRVCVQCICMQNPGKGSVILFLIISDKYGIQKTEWLRTILVQPKFEYWKLHDMYGNATQDLP